MFDSRVKSTKKFWKYLEQLENYYEDTFKTRRKSFKNVNYFKSY